MTSVLVMVDITQITAEHEHKIPTKTKKTLGSSGLYVSWIWGKGGRGVNDVGRDGLTKDSDVKLHHGKCKILNFWT